MKPGDVEIRVTVELLDSKGTVLYDAVCLSEVEVEFDKEDGGFYDATVSPGFPGDVDSYIDEALAECEGLFPYDTEGQER